MSQAQFTLSWDAFQQNLFNGLGALQQNEDLVDMTLAADGHFVKVHQLVLSLASPYLRDLIKSAQCQNPVIFLNKVSSTVLTLILEYIYTGQVVVAKENIEELLEAAKSLHIKGLMDMNYQLSLTDTTKSYSSSFQNTTGHQGTNETIHNPLDLPTDFGDSTDDDPFEEQTNTQENSALRENSKGIQDIAVMQKNAKPTPDSINFQYSVTNKGNLQIILNRFVYFLRYTGKSGHRQWRCTDYTKKKCPASVTTKDNIVLRRTSAHIHPFHDKKIARKVRANAIFSLISDAEKQGDNMKGENRNML
ncbi:broad-complex core protein isoforms 1/2/3/4/5-like isoform X3 [Plodia interpunctella]|uniref:broad-complex core protein isoforms 1/2/3/4/5-like isoform X3 n=1 Tax=Plodia interpunctella TaxID=58824 RepID=UPI002368833A|nr:broad-complex core protein isoforms 1/2/3/4/5-like isoform X3 [Plodia interpunctella]